MISSATTSVAGQATRAVYEAYHREIAARRRWVLAERSIVAVLVGAALLVLVAEPLGLSEAVMPLAASVSPFGLLGGWLLWRDQILTLLGRPGKPRFPTQMLEIALRADEAARAPHPFGTLPAAVQTSRTENR